MGKEFIKIFKEPKNLEILAKLVSEGRSYLSIAKYFGIDHSSVIHQCKKHGFVKGKKNFTEKLPEKLPRKPKVIAQRIPKNLYTTALNDWYENGEKILGGHPYSWYIAKEKERKEKIADEEFKRLTKSAIIKT